MQIVNGRWIPLNAIVFYEQSRKTYAVIATAERRPYGCFMITKGVITP